jgi:Tfp pilus assembly PilM family ATPase
VKLADSIKQGYLGEWLSRRSAFPLKGGGAVTALDCDGPVLRVAQSVRQGDKPDVVHFAAERLDQALGLGKTDPEASGARLSHALQRLKIKPGAVVMGIPRGLVFLRTLTLPKPETRDELTSMVHFQISKDLPFRLEEAVIDFQVKELPIPEPKPNGEANGNGKNGAETGTPAPAKVQVLVAVVRKEIVQYYQRLARAAGFKLAALGLDSYANARGVEACGLKEGRRVVALVSIRQVEVIIDVIAGGVLAFSRTAAFTGAQGGEGTVEAKTPARPGEGGVTTIAIEVVRSLHNYEGIEGHEPVEEILVAGAGEAHAGLVEGLAQRCQLPCRRLNPVSVFGVASKDGDYGAGALTALGLALSAQDAVAWPFDFLHPKRLPVARNVRQLQTIAVASALLLLVGGVWGTYAILKHQRLTAIQQLKNELEPMLKNRPVYRDMRLRAKAVHDWAADKREWLDHYAFLSTLLPDCSEVYVTSISSGPGGVLHLSVQARSGEVLAQVDKRLRDAGYRLRPLAVTPSSDKYGYSFQSSLELTIPPKMKLDLVSAKAPERPGDDVSMGPGSSGGPGSAGAPRSGRAAGGGRSMGGRKQP